MTLARLAVVCLGALLSAAASAASGGERPGAASDAAATTVTADPARTARDPARDCGTDTWPGPWTACPDADWLAAAAERADLAVTGDTQSALVVEGNGPSFFLWATTLTRPVAEMAADEDWRVFGRSAGVDVYGDGALWLWWVAQGRVVWIHVGPTADARAPTRAELAPLIRATRELAAPTTK